MNKVITINMGADQAVTALLKHLLETEKVAGVLTLRKINKKGSVDYALVTQSEALSSAEPLLPVMPANAAQMLSALTPAPKPIAVVVKPCELRGFVERIKRKQGSLENVLTISMTCGGVIPISTAVKQPLEKLLPEWRDAVGKNMIFETLRPTCKACEYFVPLNADITVSMLGESDLNSACRLILNSEAAVKHLEGFGEIADGTLDNSVVKAQTELRQRGKDSLFNEIKSASQGLDGMIDTFGKCIGCHGCSRVCPICYCLLCDFESHNFDQTSGQFGKELEKKGALRLPPDTLFFHLGRLSHMSFSCVGCGQCSDVCPADIPVASVFKKIGEATAALFEYIPGKDLNEDIPVKVFKEEEFVELGE